MRRRHAEETVIGNLGHDLVRQNGGDDHTSRGEGRGGGEEECKGGLHIDCWWLVLVGVVECVLLLASSDQLLFVLLQVFSIVD